MMRLVPSNEPGRVNGPNPDQKEDLFEIDQTKVHIPGAVLSTEHYKGFTLVLINGQGLWKIQADAVPAKLDGHWTDLITLQRAIDKHLESEGCQ